jgi:hypothetical protein
VNRWNVQRAMEVSDLTRLYRSHRERHGGGSFRMMVELTGAVRTSIPLTSWVDRSPCIYYEIKVERRWKRSPNGRGARHMAPPSEVQIGHDLLVAESILCPAFWITDRAAEVLVEPAEALVEPEIVVDHFERFDLPKGGEVPIKAHCLPFWVGARIEPDTNEVTLGLHYTEGVIPVNRKVVLRGMATDANGILTVRKTLEPSQPLFLKVLPL